MKKTSKLIADARRAANAAFTPGSEDHKRVMAGLASAGPILDNTADRTTYRLHQVQVPDAIDVKAIRAKTELSQEAFAHRYGFSVGAVRDWEQERKTPERSNRLLLTIIERRPEVLDELLTA